MGIGSREGLSLMRATERYLAHVEEGLVLRDENQLAALEALDQLAQALAGRRHWSGGRRGLFRRRHWEDPPKGYYLWGGVGRGKTFLMDLFVESLPPQTALRLHFHRFMSMVHSRLTALQGTVDPLEAIADELARDVKVLCFDECFVSDITDAMVLGTLFSALFRRGVALVTTSNIVPDALYQDGLQRDRFLPAIALIKAHCHVWNLDSGMDYRLRALTSAALYHAPADALAEAQLQEAFTRLCPEGSQQLSYLEINRRQIAVRQVGESVVWFEFDVLCGHGRAVPDYIEIAREYHTVIVSQVPDLTRVGDDQTRRFLHLIDELYDRSVKLILSAEVPLLDLYVSGRLRFEMDRCQSRLLEMQSTEYLERPHRPV